MDFRKAQEANRFKSSELLFGMALLVGVVVWALMTYFGKTGIGVVPFAVGIALISVWGSYWSSDKIVLTMTGAKLITEADNKQLYDLVSEVCVVTAHELAHVANRDTLVSAIAATTAGALALLSDFMLRLMIFGGGNRRDNNNEQNPIALIASLIVLILAPLAALLLRLAISRKREALADVTAVAFTRNPAGLRRALEVLQKDNTVVKQKSTAVAHIWIESPLDNSKTSQLFSTHPPLATRIATLRAMEGNPIG